MTRTLGQMNTKGRVQAEELLQLQEMGVPASQILQEELGLTSDQVANIGKEGLEANKAIQALLAGMDKRYGGMMENQSRTAKGLMSTIFDTFRNTFLRKWGVGLWEGFKPGLEKITNWLIENQDIVEEWSDRLQTLGAAFSGSIMKRVEAAQRKIHEALNSPEWENADFFGKVKIAWGEIVVNPFMEWWNSTGKQRITEAMAGMGDLIGTGLNRGIMALLGVDSEGVLEEGLSAGASFVEGFLKGFEPEKIKKVVLEAIKGIFSDSYFGGGAGLLSTLLVGSVGLKGLGMGAQVGKGFADTYSTIKVLGGLFKPAAAPGIPATVPGVPAAVPGVPGGR